MTFQRHTRGYKIGLATLLLVTLFFFNSAQAAGVPSILSYQGRLTDGSGNLLGGTSGGTYYFKFSLWNSATTGSGTLLWPTLGPTSYPVTVRTGVFSVNIGDVANGYPDTLN